MWPNSACHEVTLSSNGGYIRRPAPISGPPLGVDCLTSHIIIPRANMTDNTSAPDIPTSNIILRRKYIIPSDITIPNPYLLHLDNKSLIPFVHPEIDVSFYNKTYVISKAPYHNMHAAMCATYRCTSIIWVRLQYYETKNVHVRYQLRQAFVNPEDIVNFYKGKDPAKKKANYDERVERVRRWVQPHVLLNRFTNLRNWHNY